MEAKLNVDTVNVEQVRTLEKQVHQLLDCTDLGRPHNSQVQVLFEQVQLIESKLHALQLAQEDMTCLHQDHVFTMDPKAVQRGCNHCLAQTDSVMLSQRLDLTHEELKSVQVAIQQLQKSHVMTTDLQQMSGVIQGSVNNDNTTPSFEDHALLQRDVAAMRGELHQASAASHEELRLVAVELQSLQEAFTLQQASVEAANARSHQAADSQWHSNMQVLLDALHKMQREMQQIKHAGGIMTPPSVDVEALQDQIKHVSRQVDQVTSSEAGEGSHVLDRHVRHADCESVPFVVNSLQKQMSELTCQVKDVQARIKQLDADLQGSTRLPEKFVKAGKPDAQVAAGAIEEYQVHRVRHRDLTQLVEHSITQITIRITGLESALQCSWWNMLQVFE